MGPEEVSVAGRGCETRAVRRDRRHPGVDVEVVLLDEDDTLAVGGPGRLERLAAILADRRQAGRLTAGRVDGPEVGGSLQVPSHGPLEDDAAVDAPVWIDHEASVR